MNFPSLNLPRISMYLFQGDNNIPTSPYSLDENKRYEVASQSMVDGRGVINLHSTGLPKHAIAMICDYLVHDIPHANHIIFLREDGGMK